ncbi:Prolyl endopeptidase [Operophtera brumata]|uniref:Prolyl endopeptidase n=1 Tax=Operophtera brumata TaxID=104452 RepID=A0A0L7LNT2_OPEBR|nr:Prolyl endopeptidase [Operophtera brumata]
MYGCVELGVTAQKILDPYRWLEDPDANETKEFVEAQNRITRPYLNACPVKKDINDRLTELWNYPKYSCPFRRGDRVLYVQDSLDGEPRVFLDPNTLSEDGTVALSGSRFTEDGNTFAYGLQQHFLCTGEDYPEVLEKVKFASLSWSKDNKGLFYSKLCYHRLNTPQSEDVIVVEFPEEPLWRILRALPDRVAGEGLPRQPAVLRRPQQKLCYHRLNTPQSEDVIVVEFPEEPLWRIDVLDWATAVDNDKLVIHYVRDVKTFDLDVGSIVGFSGKKTQSEIFYHFTSFLSPGVIFHVDFKKQPYKPTDLPLNGDNPVLLYGYGGFNINIQPSFSITRLVLMQHLNGIVAIPNIRGGGEYGERWHNAGRLLNKQNVFDDFQYAAEYLVANKYTKPALITIQGGSNGGLLVAACINQRPDLFGAAIVQSAGHAAVPEVHDRARVDVRLRQLRQQDSVRVPAQYPATLVLTADHDDRVVPLHSLKFIAALQHAARGAAQHRPLLARVDTKAGHGSGKPTAKINFFHCSFKKLCKMLKAKFSWDCSFPRYNIELVFTCATYSIKKLLHWPRFKIMFTNKKYFIFIVNFDTIE